MLFHVALQYTHYIEKMFLNISPRPFATFASACDGLTVKHESKNNRHTHPEDVFV
jgi:hypothetical protein